MARPRKVTSVEQEKEPGMVRCRVLRDFWPTGDDADRVRAGSMVEVTPDDAMDGIEAGTLQRIKE